MKTLLARLALMLLLASTSLAQLITSQSVSSITASSATVNATTCAAAVGQVSYGLDTTYGSLSAADSSGTSHAIALTGLSPSTVYHYKGTFTDASGNVVVTPDATLTTAGTSVAITTNPANTTACAGTVVVLSAAASGSPAPTVQWQRSTASGGSTYANISGATSATYSFVPVAGDTGFNFRAVFTNSGGSATSTAAALTVNTIPAITTQPLSRSVVAGSSAIFTVAASGTPSPTVQWQFMSIAGGVWTNIVGSGATTTTLTLTGTLLSQSGNQVRAVLTNSCGSTNSSAATLTVTSSTIYSLSSSASSARSSGAFLQGATLSGSRYIFTSLASSATTFNVTGVSSVCYWLDDIPMTGAGLGCDSLSPFDFSSTSPASPAFVQVKTADPGTVVASVPVAFTSAQGAGNLNVIAVGWYGPSATVSATDTRGNTYVVASAPAQQTTGATWHAILYAKNIATGANTVTVTFSIAVTHPDIRAAEYSGLDTVAPQDAVASAVGLPTAASSGTLATTASGDILIGAGNSAGVFTAAGSGFSSRAITSEGMLLEDRILGVAGSYAATGTASQAWVMQGVAYRPLTTLKAWDTTKVSNGAHTITQKVAPVSGAVEVDTSTFTISNAVSHSVDLAWVKGAAVNPVTFTVARSTGACSGAFAGASKVSGLPQTTLAWTDNTVASGSTYCYAVLQTDSVSALPSAWSNQVTTVIP